MRSPTPNTKSSSIKSRRHSTPLRGGDFNRSARGTGSGLELVNACRRKTRGPEGCPSSQHRRLEFLEQDILRDRSRRSSRSWAHQVPRARPSHAAQAGDEGDGLPMAVRHMVDQSLPTWTAAAKPHHVGRSRGLRLLIVRAEIAHLRMVPAPNLAMGSSASVRARRCRSLGYAGRQRRRHWVVATSTCRDLQALHRIAAGSSVIALRASEGSNLGPHR